MNYLEDYKKSNAQERLELFMQFPDLRSNFDQIENEEDSTLSNSAQQIVIEPAKAQNKQSLFIRIKNCCLSLFL